MLLNNQTDKPMSPKTHNKKKMNKSVRMNAELKKTNKKKRHVHLLF